MIEFIVANKALVGVVIAVITASVTLLGIGLNYIASQRLESIKSENEKQLQSFLDEQKKKTEYDEVSLNSLKSMLISLQNLRSYVVSFSLNIDTPGFSVEKDEALETLHKLRDEVSSKHSAVYANCNKDEERPAHAAKNLALRLSGILSEMIQGEQIEFDPIQEILLELKEEQDSIRDWVLLR